MDTVSAASIPNSPKEMKAAISQMLRQIDELREQMKADDIAIARLNAEYAALKEEGLILQQETERLLANLRSNW